MGIVAPQAISARGDPTVKAGSLVVVALETEVGRGGGEEVGRGPRMGEVAIPAPVLDGSVHPVHVMDHG